MDLKIVVNDCDTKTFNATCKLNFMYYKSKYIYNYIEKIKINLLFNLTYLESSETLGQMI